MKLDVDVTEVVLSNVGPTGEFRIRNSAKAFKILSDGLYSNKIKAIVRELSCNALDSHVAAGKKEVPFEVHLPSMFEPWFSVRDFGVGLSADQVDSIYTTYFESTKTESNDFIGALGLGSKSPFSYTDNFTVTAIKGGRKVIFSAFINDAGVPSVTKMSDELSDEPTGLEVKFSVTDRYAYQSFRNECVEVFKWFKNKPNVIGDTSYQHAVQTYLEENLVPGVHQMHQSRGSIATMGNIAYPLSDIPDARKEFGTLASLLECSLVMEFNIGELDFSASRESLSYIPLTIASIKKRLELLNGNLTKILKEKVDAIDNEWEKAIYLSEQARTRLFGAAVEEYVRTTKFPLYDRGSYGGYRFKFDVDADLKAIGIDMAGIVASHGSTSTIGKHTKHDYQTGKNVTMFEVQLQRDVVIVLNDLKTGCLARTKYHYNKDTRLHGKRYYVYMISSDKKEVKDRQVDYDALLKKLHNPPTVVLASSLDKKETVSAPMSKQGVMKIGTKANRNQWSNVREYGWFPISDEIDDKKTYYFCALANYDSQKLDGTTFDMLGLHKLMIQSGLADFEGLEVHGVRKSRIEELKERKNWVWIEDKIKSIVKKVNTKTISDMIASTILDDYRERAYINKTVVSSISKDSPYAKYVADYGNVKPSNGDVTALVTLCSQYGNVVEVEAVKNKIREDKKNIFERYPLLKHFPNVTVSNADIAQYINLIDKQEKN